MSVDYTAVIADLEAKRDGLNALIAALQNVSRLLPGQSAVQFIEAPKAEKVVGRSVGRYKARATSREGEADPEGDRRGHHEATAE
jgi:hypothetical protein